MSIPRDLSLPKRKRVQFRLSAPEAEDVKTFLGVNRWVTKSIRMSRESDGTWRGITVLPPGRYSYTFVVDGQHRSDPHNDRTIADAEGALNNELIVYLPSTQEI